MMTDTIADFLTRIRNAQRINRQGVEVPATRMAERMLAVLESEGFIGGFELKDPEAAPKDRVFNVSLKYFGSGEPAITRLERVSRPGLRIYRKAEELPRTFSGLGISLISTSQGVMSDREARERKVGGEILARVG